jgi:hypothetical protein
MTDGAGNTKIYAAAFVDSHGSDIILHISDFGNNEALLLQAITEQLVKHPVSVGWYSSGIPIIAQIKASR